MYQNYNLYKNRAAIISLTLFLIAPSCSFSPPFLSQGRHSRFRQTEFVTRFKRAPTNLFEVRASIAEVPVADDDVKTETVSIGLSTFNDIPVFESADGPNEDRIEVETLLRPDNLLEKAACRSILDRIDDAVGLFKSFSKSDPNDLDESKKTERTRVVLVGSGWGAHAMTKTLDDSDIDIIVVSPRSYFIFTPMLASSAVGTVEYRSITEPIRFTHSRAKYIDAIAQEVDVQNKVLRCKTPSGTELSVPYDHVVLSVGMKTATFGTKGVEEHCHCLKDVEDARKLRASLIEKFESASLPDVSDEEKRKLLSFVVVGGGPTGVEFSGELFDFLSSDVEKYYPSLVPYISTTLVQSGDALLPVFSESLRRKALDTLSSYGARVLLNTRVKEVRADEIVCQSKEGDTTPFTVKCGLCVWAAGNAPREVSTNFIKSYQPWNSKGRIVTDGWQRVLGLPPDAGVFAIGDCSESESAALPLTAQVAAQQGTYLARNFNNGLKASATTPEEAYGPAVAGHLRVSAREGNRHAQAVLALERPLLRPFQFLNLGILAYTGKSSALAQVELTMPDAGTHKRGSQLRVTEATGLQGFLIWRSVYISKQVALRNRVLVLFDWAKAKLFGRDLSAF